MAKQRLFATLCVTAHTECRKELMDRWVGDERTTGSSDDPRSARCLRRIRGGMRLACSNRKNFFLPKHLTATRAQAPYPLSLTPRRECLPCIAATVLLRVALGCRQRRPAGR